MCLFTQYNLENQGITLVMAALFKLVDFSFLNAERFPRNTCFLC